MMGFQRANFGGFGLARDFRSRVMSRHDRRIYNITTAQRKLRRDKQQVYYKQFIIRSRKIST